MPVTRSALEQLSMPEMVLLNGNVVTVDPAFRIAEAVAVRDGRILAVGRSADVRELIGPRTVVLDLQGKTVLPGINDSHLHLSLWATTRPPLTLDVSYPTVKSIADVVQMVKDKAATVPPGEWIRGYGWDETYLAEWQQDHNRRPTRWDLDAVSPNNPVCLSDFTGGHIVWANSRALALAGITRDTPDPAGGNIIRDPVSGEPTGILNEPPASGLVLALLPPFTAAQLRQGILVAMRELNSIGITSLTEPGLGPFEIAGLPAGDALAVLNDLYSEGALTVRIGVLLVYTHFLGLGNLSLKGLQAYLANVPVRTGFGDDWYRIAGVKLGSDSMPPNKTAWMHEEYVGGGHGGLIVAGDSDEARYNELVNMIVYASQKRFQVGVHSTGDRAIDAVVDGCIKALQADPWDARHYVIHADFTTPGCARRMAQYGVGASVNSLIKWTIADAEVAVVGAERSAYEWPLRTLIDAGVHVANASDAPVTYPDWKLGVEAAVTRESKSSGQVSGPEQCISRAEAIRTFTVEGAWLDHMEHVKGSIEAGKLADFCVLDQDILTVDVHDIHRIPTLMTIVGGRIVHEAVSGLFR